MSNVNITHVLEAAQSGDRQAAEQLLPLVYEELRKLAAAKMFQESPGQTLQATALVHEAWLRLRVDENTSFQGRAHFFGAAAEAMRRILIDRARRKRAERHGGGQLRVDFDGVDLATAEIDDQLAAASEALDRFAQSHPVPAELVKLRYFAGMTMKEAAMVIGVSADTAKEYCAFARAWLFRDLTKKR